MQCRALRSQFLRLSVSNSFDYFSDSQASITPRLVNLLGEKTFIKLAGITETATHMQEACSSRPSYTHRRLDLYITLVHVHVRLREVCEIIAFLSVMDTYIHTYIHT